jgi:ABC-type dipeptide/oligopeptide/nickel transport system ATPase component
MSLLKVENLVVEFPYRRGTLRALDDVSFEIAPGEILGVVGESGAGKSLTGAAIIGLLEPPGRIAGGQVSLEGQRIDNLPQDKMRQIRGRKIGAIFQDPLTSLNPLYTVGRQITETIQAHLPVSNEEARKRAIGLLEDTGIPAAKERIDHYPHQFSGGMRQRVVIALALAAEPKLIVADEPTTALDVSIQAQIISLLKRVCRDRGAAVMLITHDMGVRSRGRHVRGPRCRNRPGARSDQPACAPVHDGPHGFHPRHHAGPGSPVPDRRHHAAPERDSSRLRIQPALPARVRALPRGAPRPVASRRHARRLLAA